MKNSQTLGRINPAAQLSRATQGLPGCCRRKDNWTLLLCFGVMI